MLCDYIFVSKRGKSTGTESRLVSVCVWGGGGWGETWNTGFVFGMMNVLQKLTVLMAAQYTNAQ